jgi:hypothetical protein
MSANLNFYLGQKDGQVKVFSKTSNKKLTWELLDLRHDIIKHSFEFNWGYCGSGPAQLALAILCYEFGDEFGKLHYQQFKADVVSQWKGGENFILSSMNLQVWREKLQKQKEEVIENVN